MPRQNSHIFLTLTISLFASMQVAPASPVKPATPPAKLTDMQRAQQLVNADHYEAAKPMLIKITQREPKNAPAWLLLGECYQMLEITDRSTNGAKDCYLKALAIDPNYSMAYRKLSELAATDGDYKEQIRLCNKALACPVPDIITYKTRAVANSNLHNDAQALADFEKYMSYHHMAPDNPKALELRATYLGNVGRAKEAVDTLHALQAKDPKPQFFQREIRTWMQAGKMNEALAAADKYLKRDPGDEIALLMRAEILEKFGRYDAAIKDYTTLIDYEPATKFFLARARCYEKIGKIDRAKMDRAKANGDRDRL